MFDAFTAPGRFYKGNVHTHSSASDGALPAEDVCRRYRDAGYDFLCISDHFLADYDFPLTDTRMFQSETFTTIRGAELHAPETHRGELWHILAVGLPDGFAPTGERETGPALARRARDAGAFIGIAHPQWYGLDRADGLSVDAAHAVEIYNNCCEMLSARPDGASLWDQLLDGGRNLAGFAADDAHFACEDAFGAWVHVKAARLDPDSLVDALKDGRFYASQGPSIVTLQRVSDAVAITTSPARSIVLSGPGSVSVVAHGQGLTQATLDLTPFHGAWCRLTVTDQAGKRAWSQPIRL